MIFMLQKFSVNREKFLLCNKRNLFALGMIKRRTWFSSVLRHCVLCLTTFLLR